MHQAMNCTTTVLGSVAKNWPKCIQISRCGESGHFITLIVQDKMSNLKKTPVKKTSQLMRRSHQASILWHAVAVTSPFMAFHSCFLEKALGCYLILLWQDLRQITILKLSTMLAARFNQSVVNIYWYISFSHHYHCHSLILSGEALILTLSILPCPEGWISWSIPVDGLMMRRMSVLHQNSGGIGKSIPSALEISLDPWDFPRASPSGNLSGLGKPLWHRWWISQYLPRFDGARIQY